MNAQRRLFTFGLVVLVLNTIAAVIAVALNLPTQFGTAGTDASADVFTKGTAISAPLLPVVLLLASLALLCARGAWYRAGISGTVLVACLVLIGGIGEMTAPGTVHAPKAVLVGAGLVWVAIALTFFKLAAAAFRERRPRASSRMA